MRLSRKFLSDYLDIKEVSTLDLAEDMTAIGNEYDYAGKLLNCSNLTIGKVLSCTNHPDSDHLHVCQVDIGTEILNIVCGASNVCEGIKVIVALVGANLPGGTIKKGQIRGIESNGMLCSLGELGLDNKFLSEEDRNGICILDSDAVIGNNPIEYLGLDDDVIDFELYSNRGDLQSILGMAYEIGAIYDKKVRDIDLTYQENNQSILDEFNIDIKTSNCPLFLVKKALNVKIKESPKFIKERLIASGIRPINNVVDISNYVMLETGQPLHFYDADKLGNSIIVRMANEQEKLITLDNLERSLTPEDIVICSGSNKVLGLAGVMGGLSTEITPSTENIIIESAIFNYAKIRRTSKRILRSEASARFEKGLDPNRTYMAIDRTCHLLEKYADATIVSNLVSYDTVKKEDKIINLLHEKVSRVLGINLDKETILDIFRRLGFTAKYFDKKFEVIVPSRRLDIGIEEDLIEEIGRIYGINKIEGRLPKSVLTPGSYDKVTRDIRHKLALLGLNETLTYTLVNEKESSSFTKDNYQMIKIANPMSEDRMYLRYSLLPSLLRTYNYNIAHQNKDLCLFEIGKGFYLVDDKYHEEKKLAILLSGNYFYQVSNNIKVDFYVLKGILEDLFSYLSYDKRYQLEVNELIPDELHPHISAAIMIDKKMVGFLGKLHPEIINDDIYVMEINLDKLLSNRVSKTSFKSLPKYPMVCKDMAFILDRNIPSLEVVKTIKKAGGKLLRQIDIFDIYLNDNLGKDKISLGFSLTFLDENKTLTDEEVNVIFNKIILEVENKYQAKLRDN